MYPQLADYIKTAKQKGMNDEQIKNNLSAAGWSPQDIQNALGTLQSPTPVGASMMQAQPKIYTPGIQPASSKSAHTFLKVLFFIILLAGLGGGGYYFYTKYIAVSSATPVVTNSVNSLANQKTNPIIQLPPVNLDLSVVEVPDSQNAFFILDSITPAEIKDTITPEEQLNYIQGKTFDLTLATKFINANKSVIDKFDKASQQIYFQVPSFSDPTLINSNTLLPHLNSWRGGNAVYLIKAIALAKQGKVDDALPMIFNSLKLSHNVQQSQSNLITYLVGTAMKNQSLQAIQTIAPMIKSAKTLEVFGSMLDQYKDNKEGLTLALKAEYQVQIHGVESIATDIKTNINQKINDPKTDPQEKAILTNALSNPTTAFNESETKQYLTDYYSSEVRAINQSCSSLQSVSIPKFLPSDQSTYASTENIAGKMLASVVIVDISSVFKNRCDQDTLYESTKSLFAQAKL